MTDRLPATSEWAISADDLVDHVMSDYAILRPRADERLSDRLFAFLENDIDGMLRRGEIELAPVSARICKCWPCSHTVDQCSPERRGAA